MNNFELTDYKLPKNFFCRSCSSSIISFVDLSWKKHRLNDQLFFYQKCQVCQQPIYFWQNQLTKKYYFVNKLNIVLIAPEIPGNVGTIIRLACAFDLTIHLIEPFGFIYSEKWLKRSSAGHFHLAKKILYSSWEEFKKLNPEGDHLFTSSKAKTKLNNFDFLNLKKPIYLIFGCESKGISSKLIKESKFPILKIEQTSLSSSINLAQSVGIFSYQVRVQYLNFVFS